MKANVIYWLIGLGIILSFLMPSCNSSRKIDPNAIMMDTITNYYVFKENGEKVTGIVEEKSEMYGIQDSVTLRRVFKEGILIESNVFYADGKVYLKGYFDPQKINFINKMEQFTPEGRLERVEEYDSIGRNMKISSFNNDTAIIFSYDYANNTVAVALYENSLPRVEEVHVLQGDRIGGIIKSYSFDENGNRMTPAIDKLEVLECKTGFYRTWNKEERGYEYYPMVILKMKNITPYSLDEDIFVSAAFVMEGEDIGTYYSVFNRPDSPLASGLARQVYVTCNGVTWYSASAIKKAQVKCQIEINGNPYKEVEIANEVLTSNMIQ